MPETHVVKESGKSRKKILITASTFPRWEGDTEPRFVLDLAAHMTNIYDVTVLVPASQGAKDTEILEGVRIIRYHYFPVHSWETLCYPGAIVPRIKEKKCRILLVPFLFLSLFLHLLKILPEFDAVHVHWLIPQGIVQSFFRKPYLVTGHGGDVTSFNKGIIRKLKIRCLKKAARVTVVSTALKKTVESLTEPVITPVTVIPMGVDTAKFGRQYRRENYFGQQEKRVVLFVGRLAEKKGVSYLIEAMKSINAILVIVGDGPLRTDLMEQAGKQGDKIRFLGAKTHNELKVIYASADVFVAPSVTAKDGDQEGLPTTILEAMASGVPVIASDSGGIAQLIEDGVNGLLCEERNVKQLEKNINRLLTEQQLCQQIVRTAEKTVKEFDYARIANQYIEEIKWI